ncbi:MAG: hypothetical protein NTW16_05010 [Bacteroidetes bacterium]|nr:hypothetical protein [Bacteroidota bacterium]
MAIRQISTGKYFRVIHPVSSTSRPGNQDSTNPDECYDPMVTVTVNLAVFKNQTEANNPNSEYKIKNEDRFFDHEVNVPEEEGMTAEKRQRKMGYLLLLESVEFDNADFESC